MNEQSKALSRRKLNPLFEERWFVGKGMDIGAGQDPLRKEDFKNIDFVLQWDLKDGDAQFMSKIPNNSLDFVHSSHCLEHMRDPNTALMNWIRIVKPGGFVVCIVPDELLYEQGRWPSAYNDDHKKSFSGRRIPAINMSVDLPHLLWKMPADLERYELLSSGWDPLQIGRDQTLGPCECAIEFVLRKVDEKKLF